MKKKLVFVVLFAFASVNFTSCNYIAEKKAREQFVRDSIQHAQDSIRLAEERAKFVADSLENVRLDSLALIAWGQTKFGMSLQEILATETFSNSKKPEYFYGSKLTYYDSRSVQMKYNDLCAYNDAFHLQARLKRIHAYLKDGELYQVELESYPEDWELLKNVISDCNFFVRKFSEKYGSPVYLMDYSRLSSLDFTKGEEFLFAKFKIKSKTIYIQMGEHSDLRKPYYAIYINNSEFPKAKHIDTPEEIKAKEKKKQQEDFSKNNAF